jgi:hypothetical protein
MSTWLGYYEDVGATYGSQPNAYAYALNNPLGYVDRSGREPDILALLAAATAAAASGGYGLYLTMNNILNGTQPTYPQPFFGGASNDGPHENNAEMGQRGSGNHRHTEFQGMPDAQVQSEYDKETDPARRKKLEEELKARGKQRKSKDRKSGDCR